MRDSYAEQGYLFPIPALSPEEAARHRDAYLRLATALGGAPKATELALLHLYYDWAWELIHHPRVLDAVESVLGPNILVWASSVFPKRAHDPGYISMHQDGTYWGLDEGEITTAWIALTPSTPKNGCMRVVAGSHLKPILPHKETWAENNLLTRGQEVQVDVKDEEITDISLQPGEMSLHHVRIIHGSNPNPSDVPRVGYAIRYMTPDVRPQGAEHPAVLVRGKDTRGHWALTERPPAFATFDEALAAHRAASAEHLRALTSTPSAAR
ncbi:MAG: phytanoyl-CoA dioxygenase [Acidobacteria bacterium]|nr:phytanoyl-CoA dioxygenase [Acidobacteriota bacterium]